MPIRLRGQTIGVLDVHPRNGSRQWTQDELAVVEAAADRAALALENARLVESAQRRAGRERAIGEISARVSAVSDRELILQTAVEELGRKIGNTEVRIEIDVEDPSLKDES
jgi:GAF domain-containing protein